MIIYIFVAALFGIGLYALILKDNMIKKVIGMGIIAHGVHLFIINIGYRPGGIAPIITPENIAAFSMLSVDPLPQALVLTAIVIDFGITMLALSLVIMLHRHFDTLSAKRASRMRG